MTLSPLTFDWPMMSPLSDRPPYSVPADEWLLEIDEEIAFRAHSYPLFVRERRMKPETAERHGRILAAIRDDIAERLFYGDENWTPGSKFRRVGPAGIGFEAKVRELRREIDIRRNSWPQAINARRLDRDRAALRMERLEAVHFAYWVELICCDFDVADPDGPDVPLSNRLDAVRAWVWRVQSWEREAMSRGDPAARPDHASYYAALDRGDPAALLIWNGLEEAATRHGFLPTEQEEMAA